MLGVECEEPFVRLTALFFQHTDINGDASLTNLPDAAALYLGERVHTAADHTADSLTDDKIAAWRCLAPVGARLKRDVDGGVME